jgi:GT2 family glycosyltransferase
VHVRLARIQEWFSMIAVIPAFLSRAHQAAQLRRCVAALLIDPEPPHVVVVDDGSPMAIPPLPERVEVLQLATNAGPAAARNRGLERALELGTDVVLFTDVDCVPAPGWARAMAGFLADGAHVAAGGVTRSLGATLLDRYHDFAGSLNGRWLLPARDELLFAATCNLAVRATALAEVRFDVRFPSAAGEDVDFCLRLRARGRIGLATRALVHHDFGYPSTVRGLGAFLRTFRRYGAADPLLWEKHPELRLLPTEGCAAADLLAREPAVEPEAWRRGALRRVRPRRYKPALFLLSKLARLAHSRGRAAPAGWRAPADATPPTPGRMRAP